MLYLVGTPIGNLQDITLRAIDTLKEVDLIACEDTRVSKKLLQKYGIQGTLISYHEHNADVARPKIIVELLAGKSVALISDAGMPVVSDPGYKLVDECKKQNIPHTVIPGPSAPVTALALSGIAPLPFYFAGFTPHKKTARRQLYHSLSTLESTLVFFEAPSRLLESLKDARDVLGNRQATVCRELTKMFEEGRRGDLEDLIKHYEEYPPKGEIVLVMEGAKKDSLSIDIDAELDDALQHYKTKQAAEYVAQKTGLSKKEIYQRALERQKKKQ